MLEPGTYKTMASVSSIFNFREISRRRISFFGHFHGYLIHFRTPRYLPA